MMTTDRQVQYSLAIDKRERDILRLIKKTEIYKDANGKQILWREEHLTTGDFIIFCNNKAIMVIERKTWKDLAASIKDGRITNIKKLIKYRTTTGAKIAYLVEGQAFPSNRTRFGRIPYPNLRSHLDHLVFRDDVIEIRTLNLFGTIDRLFQLIKNISSIKTQHGGVTGNGVGVTGNGVDVTSDGVDVTGNGVDVTSDGVGVAGNGVDVTSDGVGIDEKNDLELAKIKHSLSDTDIIRKLWVSIPGINENNYMLFANYHISDIITGNITKEQIAELKYSNNKKIGIIRAKKICIVSNPNLKINNNNYINILAAIPGISKRSAGLILSHHRLHNIILKWTDVKQSFETLKIGKRTIGKKIIDNIEKYLVRPSVC
jgi:hypothetical protein